MPAHILASSQLLARCDSNGLARLPSVKIAKRLAMTFLRNRVCRARLLLVASESKCLSKVQHAEEECLLLVPSMLAKRMQAEESI